jgi:CHAT domain-containing protein
MASLATNEASCWRGCSGAIADVEKVRALPPLPETADELRAIAKELGATEDDLLLGERASEPVLRQTPIERYKAVALATHGLMSQCACRERTYP